MPTYEYLCLKCGHDFEKFQSMSDAPLAVCPKEKCAQKKWGRGKVKKKISAGAGLIFKGSGFYITDYRSDKYKEAAKNDSTASKPADNKPADSKAASGTENKAPAKTESKPAKPAPKS